MTAAGWAGESRPTIQWKGETMGSFYFVKAVDCTLAPTQLEQVKKGIADRLTELNRQMSHYIEDSELSRFNRAAANQPFKVSAEFAQVMRLSLEINRQSDGFFDPALGALINLWGFGPKGGRHEPPPDTEIQQAMQRVGAQHVKVTPDDELVKDIAGLQLDLGAITKGFGVDAMAGILLANNVSNFYAAISGEVYVHGYGPSGGPWRIGIDVPEFDALPGEAISMVVPLSNLAISTSGNYRKYFRDHTNKVYAHILNPRTGRPLTHSLASVSIVATNCALADALATATYALGPERGLTFIENQPEVSAYFIVRNADGTFRQFASRRFPKSAPPAK